MSFCCSESSDVLMNWSYFLPLSTLDTAHVRKIPGSPNLHSRVGSLGMRLKGTRKQGPSHEGKALMTNSSLGSFQNLRVTNEIVER